MRKSRFLTPTLLGILLTAAPGNAQEIDTGTWVGVLHLTGGPAASVEFTVHGSNGTPEITMNTIGGPVSPVLDLEVTADGAVFRWGAFACSMMLTNDAVYQGQCVTPDGTEGVLLLNPPKERGNASDVLTYQDLFDTNELDVFAALERLRPYWIHPRGQGRMGYAVVVMVYVNSQPMGDMNVLRDMRIEDVQDVTYLNASDATTRFGTNNEGGAILVTRRRGYH